MLAKNGLTFVENSCQRKRAYASKADARRAMKGQAYRPKWQRGVGKLEVYYCSLCGQWHVGHRKGT